MTETELLAEHEATIAKLREELAAARALNDWARLALIRLRGQLDQAIEESRQFAANLPAADPAPSDSEGT